MADMSEQWKGAFCAECNDANADTLRQTASNVQPQLPPSPLIQPAPAAPAVAPAAGSGSSSFVVPPPLPPQAAAGAQPAFVGPQSSSALSFEDFKEKLAQAFGPVG